MRASRVISHSPIAAVPTAAAPVAATAAPIAATVAAAPVAAGVGRAGVAPGGSPTALIVASDKFVTARAIGVGVFSDGVGRGVGMAAVTARELVVKPVAGQGSAQSPEHPGEEPAAAAAAI